MTPQERQMIDDLFDRLARLESAPRDPDAVAAIAQGLRQAPNAVYALVQTVLVQDEALKRANSRIQELEAGGAPAQQQPGGFLNSMRGAIFGQEQPHGSVPNVPPPSSRPVWNSGQVMQQAQSPGHYDQTPYGQPSYGQPSYGQPYGASQPPMGGGGSFLGTAAAAAAGMIGGSLLLGSIRSMMGGSHQGFGDAAGLGSGLGSALAARRPGAINPAARWRATPGSTTSVHPQAVATTIRAPDCSIRRRTTIRHRTMMVTTATTWIWIPTISAATATATTPDRLPDHAKQNGRPIGRPFQFSEPCGNQMTTTLAPTLTRPYRSITSSLRIRMQPDETLVPMVQGSLEPWMR